MKLLEIADRNDVKHALLKMTQVVEWPFTKQTWKDGFVYFTSQKPGFENGYEYVLVEANRRPEYDGDVLIRMAFNKKSTWWKKVDGFIQHNFQAKNVHLGTADEVGRIVNDFFI